MAMLVVNDFDTFGTFADIAQLPDEVKDEMLLAGAEIVAEAQIAAGMKMGVYETGMTLSSIRPTKPKTDNDGNRVVDVYAQGRNEDGTRNAEVAFVNEYGTSKQLGRPFTREGNATAQVAVVKVQEEIFNRHLERKGY